MARAQRSNAHPFIVESIDYLPPFSHTSFIFFYARNKPNSSYNSFDANEFFFSSIELSTDLHNLIQSGSFYFSAGAYYVSQEYLSILNILYSIKQLFLSFQTNVLTRKLLSSLFELLIQTFFIICFIFFLQNKRKSSSTISFSTVYLLHLHCSHNYR